MNTLDTLLQNDKSRLVSSSTKTIGCLRDFGWGQSDPASEADPKTKVSLQDVFEGQGNLIEKTRPMTPPLPGTAQSNCDDDTYLGQDTSSSVVTLGCIRDLFGASWRPDGDMAETEDVQEFLNALNEETDPSERLESMQDWLTLGKSSFNTIATGSRDEKPGIATLFASMEEEDTKVPAIGVTPLSTVNEGAASEPSPTTLISQDIMLDAPKEEEEEKPASPTEKKKKKKKKKDKGKDKEQLLQQQQQQHLPQDTVPVAPITTQPQPPTAVPDPAAAADAVTASGAAAASSKAASPPPCSHNNWDNVRVKKGFFGLRCRNCGANWKVPIKLVAKCPAFFNGYCPNGVNCPLPHIHRYKNPEKEKEKTRAMVVSQLRAHEAAQGLGLGEEQEQTQVQAQEGEEINEPKVVEDAVMEVGVAVHVAPSPSDDEVSFLKLGGVATVIEPGYCKLSKKWHVESREQGTFWVPEELVKVAWKRGEAPTSKDKLESMFAVPLLMFNGQAQEHLQTLPPDKAELLQKLVSEKLIDPVFTTAMASRPCNHNNWDNVRIVKGKIGLRCRCCGIHWKTEVSAITKCPAFFNGYCPNGVSCPLPHIHRYKNKEKEAAKAKMVAMTLQQAAQAGGEGQFEDGSKFAVNPEIFTQSGEAREAKKESTQKTVSSEVKAAPCQHNSWVQDPDKPIMCEVCEKVWVTSPQAITQCPAFFNGYCHAGTNCPMAHVRWTGVSSPSKPV